MNLNEYQQLALRTSNKGKVTGVHRLTVAALGLSGEAGEFADLVKKHIGQGHHLYPLEGIKELGDVLWYISEAADELGFSLEEVAEANIAKLRARYPKGFSTEASIARFDANGSEPA